MQSSSRQRQNPNFWIPPDTLYESAEPIATRTPEPATPTRGATRTGPSTTPLRASGPTRPPPLPLSSQRTTFTNGPSTAIAASAPQRPPAAQTIPRHSRTGKEFNRRERRFETLFDQWTKKMAELEEEHRLVTLTCTSEEQSKTAMDDFNRKAQDVFTRFNDQIEALQMSSSEPGSSQSEASEDDDEDEDAEEDAEDIMAGPTPIRSRVNQDDAEEDEDDDDEEEEEEDEEEEEEEDAEEGDDIEGDRASTPPSEVESGDDTDHSARKSCRSSKGYQSSEVSHGSLGIHTPPPTEVDEDWRATRRRQAREQRKADELASALPQRLRSGTLRGASPASSATGSIPLSAPPRPAAMSLFETLSSSPASASSMQASRRPSRDVSAHSVVDPDPSQTTSRIDFLRRQNSLSGSDRSLSRPRQPSPSPSPVTVLDESRLFRDQFDNWRNMARERSDHWIRIAEQQTEDSKSLYTREQEEKHKRAQQLFIAHQDKLLQQYSRNRSGSTGQASAAANSPVNGFHARTGSFVASSSPHVMGPSASPTANRHAPVSSSPATNRPLQSSASQTFQFATTPSQSPPGQQGHSQSPSHTQTRSWVPSQTGLSSAHSAKFNHPASSDSDEDNEAVDEEESDIGPVQTFNGTPPISIPNSTRGAPGSVGNVSGAPSTPRNNFVQPQPPSQSQHLRTSSSTTFSSSGTASTRSSGASWSGVSGTSSNTTVTSSDTPGSRRGSIGDKSFVIPIDLHNHRKPTLPLPTGNSASPPNAQAPPRWNLDGGSTTHSPASTLSRSSTLPLSAGTSTGSSRTTAQQWQAMLSSSPSAPPVVTAANGSAITNTPPSSSTRPIPTSINLGQSPSKTTWKTMGQPSPPIPTQTRPINVSPLPPQWTRSDSSSTLSSSPSFAASFATPKPSPPLRSVMSNSDMASPIGSSSTLRIRSSVASFSNKPAATEEEREPTERLSRSISPTKPALIPAKAAPSPPTVTSPSTETTTAEKTPQNEPVLYPLRKEKRKVKAKDRERHKAEEEEKRKKAEEEEQRRKADEEETARIAEEERQKEQEAREEQERIQRERETEERLQRERELEERLQREREAEERRKKEEEAKRQQKRAEDERRKRDRQEKERLRKLREEDERRKKREEEERLRLAREEEERQEKEREEEESRLKQEAEQLELQRKHDEEVRRREEMLKERERELRRREEELERTRKEEELQRKEAELRKREEAIRKKEAELRRQREERLKEDQEEVVEPESSPTQPHPSSSIPSSSSPSQSRKVDQKKRKKARDEQKEREAALARQQAEEEREREENRRREEELRQEEERQREEERLQEEARLAEEEDRLRREREDEEAANALAAAIEAERLENERMEAERIKQQRLKEELRRQEAAALEEMNRERMARKQREDEQRQAQLRRDREEAIRIQREEEDRQAQWQEQRRRYEEEQRRHRNSRADEERRQEEEQRRQEERIRQENDRLTEMFKAKERTQQMSTNMPKRYSDAWEAYNAKWSSLVSSAQGEERPVITFAKVPWPTLNPPSGPDAINRNVVGGFILSQWHSKEKNRRDRIREALRRWHPDHFESRYLNMVPEGEERENVRIGVGNVTRSLNELLTTESSGGHL